MLKRLNRNILEILYPSRAVCMGCGDIRGAQAQFLCANCQKKRDAIGFQDGPDRCPRCGSRLREEKCSVCGEWPAGMIDRACYAYDYAPPVDRLIRSFKYSAVTVMRGQMACAVAEAAARAEMGDAELVVPVPMHWWREHRRGYNQSRLIAEDVAVYLGMEFSEALKRLRATPQQARLSAEGRRKNLVGAFRAAPCVAGKCILLIDDVRTTGSTVLTCAEVLRLAGARKIYVATMAGVSQYG